MAQSHVGVPRGLDAASVLLLYSTILLAVPAPLIVASLGTAGSPATLLAIASFLWWCWFHIQRDRPPDAGYPPLRWIVICLLIVMLVVYAHSMLSPLPSAEMTPADSGMLRLIGLAGVLLVANDGLGTWLQVHRVLRLLVLAVGVVAALGVLQYVTRQPIVDRISIPGLTPGNADWTLAQRSGFTRPSGTSTHPIEYGVVLTMVLPVAIVLAQHATHRRWLFRAALAAISFSILLSISRSAIICAAVALVVLASAWSLKNQLRALAALVALLTLVYLTVPGMLGTITRLFTGIAEDTSIASRTGSYELAGQFISRSPWLGRGLGTFIPDYWILDNQYLGLLIEAGILGFVAFLMMICAALVAALGAMRGSTRAIDTDTARALCAAVLSGAAGFAFFDTFAFPQSAGCLFLMLGLSGAAWGAQRRERPQMPTAVEPGLAHPGREHLHPAGAPSPQDTRRDWEHER